MEEIKNKPKTKAQKEREKSDATFKKLEEQASKLKEKAKKRQKENLDSSKNPEEIQYDGKYICAKCPAENGYTFKSHLKASMLKHLSEEHPDDFEKNSKKLKKNPVETNAENTGSIPLLKSQMK